MGYRANANGSRIFVKSYPPTGIRMRIASRLLLVAAAAMACLPAHATRLTFDGIVSVGLTQNTSYGDRVVAAGTGLTLDGGATPNVIVNFRSLLAGNTEFEVYSNGYSGLASALGDTAYDVPGYFELIPDAGFDVVLESFVLGAWSTRTYPNSQVRIVDLGPAQTEYFNTGLFAFPGNTVFSYPKAPIRSTNGLRVYISDFGDLGLDNVQFSQVATIPEPGTWALMALGLAGVAGLARRRSQR
jgi:hypothetical protein